MKSLLSIALGAGMLGLGLFPLQVHASSVGRYDRLFNRADLDSDQFLSLTEFVAMQPRSTSWVDAKWRFNFADTNTDNHVDRFEFLASRGGKDGRRPSKANTFLIADEDEDGYLDPSEYSLTQPRNRLVRSVERHFLKLDRDHDQQLSPKEFGLRNVR